MKIRTVVISLAVTAALVAGAGYGAYYSMQSQKKPVDVVPVANINFGFWGDTASMAGTIISRDTQNVKLDGEKNLVKVYVKEGDEVRVGDPLLEYDMTMTELQEEMEQLTRQTLDLNMQSLQRELDKWMRTRATASLEIDVGILTASAEDDSDILYFEEVEPQPEDYGDPGGGQGETFQEPLNPELVEDSYNGQSGMEPAEDLGDFLIEDEGDFISEGTVISQEEVLRNINEFLSRVNLLPTEADGMEQLYEPDIEMAMNLFRQKLAITEISDTIDLLGDTRTRTKYTLLPQMASLIDDANARVVSQAYDRVCVYRFLYKMNQIELDEEGMRELDDEEFLAYEGQIRAALDAYYDIQESAFTDYEELLEPYLEQMGAMIFRLQNFNLVQETELSTEDWDLPEDEPEDYGDYGDYGGDYGGESYTLAEIREMVSALEKDIQDCQLDIRESELRLKQYQRELDKKIVRSSMNGVVKYAGTVEESVSEENFIVITGASGMYVKGTINELKLDTVTPGTVVQGVSFETGMSFTAEITEISPYPSSGNDYWGYGSDNSNASYYPFLAYIEQADGLEEGDVELTIVEDTPSTGIYLEEYYIRSENGNKKYVYIQGQDGLLKKQYVETGASVYGEVEIKRGLSMQDRIAFPYGKDVVEGAATREVDNMDALYGYY